MIFVNRHRIIQNSGVIKDPTKYWYIEKYVYGVLRETVEVPLRTSTTFSALSSGYDDDEFYGWSISSTSTTRTFTNTTAYSNTTATVKNNLDSEKTLKIYAIYSYYKDITFNFTATSDNTTSAVKRKYIVVESGAVKIGGYNSYFGASVSNGSTVSSGTNYGELDLSDVLSINGVYIEGTVNTSPNVNQNIYDYHKYINVQKDDLILVELDRKDENNITNGNGSVTQYWQTVTFTRDTNSSEVAKFLDCNKNYYRVQSHIN